MQSENSNQRFGLLYGCSHVMTLLYRQIERVALTDATVMLEGESGTGKELIAQSIHKFSSRAKEKFIAVNCGAIPENLIEAALFGHEKGSFTGAVKLRAGYFEHASDGTLFLDEITEMALDMQVKLLRVLECGSFMRVGGNTEIKVNVRLIAATNRTLLAAVQDGRLRPDLMYRLAVFPIRVPALRERGDDVKLLAHHFLDELNLHGSTDKKFSKQALDKIKSRNWSGNVRELKNYVQRAYILATDKLVFDDEPFFSGRKFVSANGILNFYAGTPLAVAQREIILATLQQFRGNKQIAARTLGISLKTLYNRLKDY